MRNRNVREVADVKGASCELQTAEHLTFIPHNHSVASFAVIIWTSLYGADGKCQQNKLFVRRKPLWMT